MRSFAAVAVAILCAAQAPPTSEATTGARAPEAAVRAVLDEQVQAWNRGDLQGFMAGYWNSPQLVFHSGATATRGWQATLERYQRRYQGEGKEMGRLRFEELEIQALCPDAALARGRWRLVLTDGSQPNGLFTLLVRRIGGEWKIVHDHTS